MRTLTSFFRKQPEANVLDRCVSVDLEVDPKTAQIFDGAAVWFDDARPPLRSGKNIRSWLNEVETALRDSEFLLGHNILRHDLPHLCAAAPKLAKLSTAPIDTLWLNPLAFPENPYHHLVKHYQDGRLQAGHVNDPEQDARLVFDVLRNQLDAFDKLARDAPDLTTIYHFLTSRGDAAAGFDAVFRQVRGKPKPDARMAEVAVRNVLQEHACAQSVELALSRIGSVERAWPLAFALAWVSVSGGNSVMPPWVRRQFPQAADIVKELRDTDCKQPDCGWCRERNDPQKALKRWFGFDGFRPQPADENGLPLQERIVAEAMAGESVLGILPTGTGKSVCYQIPALTRFDKTGALTVVISPLVALMADQVQGLERVGISAAVTINGMLSMPERQDALDRVRLGDASILLIAPEQLRSVSVRTVLAQREVGLWVLDESHCVSKWGHDFRPDYRYIGRFIREFTGDRPHAPILCLTATAKPEVVSDIIAHFKERLNADLTLLDGGSVRTNLDFEVRETNPATKMNDILDVIDTRLPDQGASGAIVYCATRASTEKVAEFLKAQGLAAAHYHAGLSPEEKTDVQAAFHRGTLRVIAATNAFGMGIDKPDIRLVVHGDIPGSLENYLQEAGRAGRDREPANCVLLFAEDDIERQFSLTARSRLARHEISAILKALRRLDGRVQDEGKIVATPGEIVRAEVEDEFDRDKATDDTRVKTAVSWLEEARLLSREENRVAVFPASLSVRDLDTAMAQLDKANITGTRRKALRDILSHVMTAAPDQGISTDELTGISGLTLGGLTKAMADLEVLGLLRNDMAVTVFVHAGVQDSSQRRLSRRMGLETDLISLMRETAPDADQVGGQEPLPLSLAETTQALRDAGHEGVRPDIVEKMLRGMARDGRDQDGGTGSLRLRKPSRNTVLVTLQRTWAGLEKTADLRRRAGELLLARLLGKLGNSETARRGKDLKVETTVGELAEALTGDALFRAEVRDSTKLMERALLWLHEQEVVTLGKGLSIFRPAITVHLEPGRAQFTKQDFAPLEAHYAEQTLQTHVMAGYAKEGLQSMARADKLAEEYFALDQAEFLSRWMPKKASELRRQTSSRSYQMIVGALGHPVQEKIVADDREQTSMLVLAGPGSGKTRVLVHRVAYLIRVRRENPRGILVLSYNRHAAAEIRVRLRHLIGEDANGVTVSTCHALAMRLVGTSFAGMSEERRDFDGIVLEAAQLLRGDGLSKAEAEAQREALIEGYRWILVDEYQDIGPEEYELIAAVAGRTQEDPDLRLSLFAVGDDDQNIYAFAGASIRYIRQFEEDYRAKAEYLVENFRSTGHVVTAANAVIAPAGERMKTGHDIVLNTARRADPAGGVLAAADPVAAGRVQLLQCGAGAMVQAAAALDEMQRLAGLDPDWSWTRTAVISRNWKQLEPVRALAEARGIPVEMANESLPSIWRLREMQTFIAALRRDPVAMLGITDLLDRLSDQPPSRWTDLIAEGIAALADELADKQMPVPDLIEWFGEWARDTRGEQRGLLLLTAHRAKGLEFDHVAILDGGWDRTSKGEDADAPRRLFYVAMTRARRSLTVLGQGRRHAFVSDDSPAVLARRVDPALPSRKFQIYSYVLPEMSLVDLSFAGRLRDGSGPLTAISEAQVGDPLNLRRTQDRWEILDAKGRRLGRMARRFAPPEGKAFIRGMVGAIVRWRAEDSEEKYRAQFHRADWETVLPELHFGSDAPPKPAVRTPVPSAETDVHQALHDVMKAAVSEAHDWQTLSVALARRNLELAPKGGGLVLRDSQSGAELAKASSIGFAYANLIKRFGAGFPGHTHTWVAERALSQRTKDDGVLF